MANRRPRKKPSRASPEDNSVPVRVSARSPRVQAVPPKRPATPPVARAQNLATAMLEALIGQLADYIENSHAVEKLIRAQTAHVLHELARDPQLANLIRAQAEQYVAELVSRPEILEPLVRVQLDLYLDHLKNDPARRAAFMDRIQENPPPKPPKRRPKPEIKIE